MNPEQVISQTWSRLRSPEKPLWPFPAGVVLSIRSPRGALLAHVPFVTGICRSPVRLKPNTHAALLKKALLTTLIVAVPGGMLLALAYLLAKAKPTPAASQPPTGE